MVARLIHQNIVLDTTIEAVSKREYAAENKESLTSVSPRIVYFDPNNITILDLSQVDGSRNHIFQTGCIPEWILNFTNLQLFRASKMGIIILEPWILNLEHLNSLYLEHNQINTWPFFLRDSKSLEQICLDGNPCLEKAFQKSPTLRSFYFSWFYTTDACRAVPSYIRGPEWPPASSARQSNNATIRTLGFFCGGIYALSSPLIKTDHDELLTVLQPCPLQQRIYSTNKQLNEDSDYNPTLDSNSLNTDACSVYSISHTKPDFKESRLLFEIFDDISALKKSESFPSHSSLRPRVLLVGTPKDNFNRLLTFSNGSIQQQMLKQALLLLGTEEIYIQKLQIVNNQFYNAKAKASSITNCFRDIFSGFPTMLTIHSNLILPTLKALIQAIGSAHQDLTKASTPKASSTIRITVDKLCAAFARLDKILEQYTFKICDGEYLLNMPRSPVKLYEDEEFGTNIRSRISKLGNSTIHLSSTISGNSSGPSALEFARKNSLALHKNSMDTSSAKLSSNLTLSNWIYKEQHKSRSDIKYHPMNFFYLPLVQLVRFERFFTSLARINVQFVPILHLLRKQRSRAATEVQAARQRARSHILEQRFKTNLSYFDNYLWDAVISVRSRGYFEPGILAKNTNDVLFSGEPVSFVKEVFSPTQTRVLRLICCGNEILIWDEIFEHFIVKIAKQRLIAMRCNDEKHRSIGDFNKLNINSSGKVDGSDSIGGSNSEIRIIFVDARETCLVEVKGFTARYLHSVDYCQEFLDACRVKCKDVF